MIWHSTGLKLKMRMSLIRLDCFIKKTVLHIKKIRNENTNTQDSDCIQTFC